MIHNYIPRQIESCLSELSEFFPVISLTGPRQSGKSTLLQHKFPNHTYLNLENLALREAAQEDPVGFLQTKPGPLLIDEVQRAPKLFSQIQVEADKQNTPARFVLSGSQNFLLMPHIQQSLAGRVGLLTLLPLSYAEIHERGTETGSASRNESSVVGTGNIENYMLQGGFPRTYERQINNQIFFDSYLQTYLQRDVGEVLNVRNLTDFRRFLTLAASRVGNLINNSEMASALGVAVATVKSWISVLQASHILLELPPYHANIGKRLTKTPKLYFTDTGLLCHLLRIRTMEQLLEHPARGAIFENLVVSERVKYWLNRGRVPEMYFYRDASGIEVDLVDLTSDTGAELFEMKAGMSLPKRAGAHLKRVGDMLDVPAERRAIVYRGEISYQKDDAKALSFADFALNERA